MRICMVGSMYNERPYLPHIMHYYNRMGIEVYIIDNYSDDGTWEWLQENNIPSHRLDTGGAFDLRALQEEMTKTIHVLQPDWVMQGSADLYYCFDKSIKDILHEVDGYNQIKLPCWNMKYTGEDRGLPFYDHFFHGENWREIVMISRYDKSLKYIADHIDIPDPKIKSVPGVIINYGGCKTKEERYQTLARRKLAWERGLCKDWGYHYRDDAKKDFQYKKDQLQDIRIAEAYRYIINMKETLK